nr:unnamed protein product [Naegleria fowleri]
MAEENRATKDMCEFCFDTIIHHLQRSKESLPSYPCDDRFPLFVTWKKKPALRSSFLDTSTEEYHLRGCIGTFSPLALSDGLRQYAIIAAFKDHRFDPIAMSEVPQLKCAVSLLVNFEEVDVGNVYDWEIGTHGIRIKFEVNGRDYGGTYLPEVAKEQEWTKEETLSSLIRKAGFKGKVTQSLLESIELERYQSSKVDMTYEEYAECKNNRVGSRQLSSSNSLGDVDDYDSDESNEDY